MQVQPAPGWYSDPWRAAPLRWWDGVQWTDHTYQSAFPPVAADTLTRARTDLRGGGIALLGFVGANLLGLGCALLAGKFGVPACSVGAAIFGLFGLWTGLTLTAYVITHRREGGTLADVGFVWPTGRELRKGFRHRVSGRVRGGAGRGRRYGRSCRTKTPASARISSCRTARAPRRSSCSPPPRASARRSSRSCSSVASCKRSSLATSV